MGEQFLQDFFKILKSISKSPKSPKLAQITKILKKILKTDSHGGGAIAQKGSSLRHKKSHRNKFAARKAALAFEMLGISGAKPHVFDAIPRENR